MNDFRPRHSFSSVMAKIYAAVVLLLVVSFGARLIWWLLQPIIWLLVTTVVLGLVYVVIFRGLRR
jgi:membrane protein YdbS with pleckstrin-like domain